MGWMPRIREAGWFKTGRDGPPGSHRYAARHLFMRLEQDMNGTGEWTLQLSDCGKGAEGRVIRVYPCKSDARQALAFIYALTQHLGPLTDRLGNESETGRWEVHSYELSPADQVQLARAARQAHQAPTTAADQ